MSTTVETVIAECIGGDDWVVMWDDGTVCEFRGHDVAEKAIKRAAENRVAPGEGAGDKDRVATMTTPGLSGRGRKGGLAADHTSPLRRIMAVVTPDGLNLEGSGWGPDTVKLRLECGHIVDPLRLGDFAFYMSATNPVVGKRRRCYDCAALAALPDEAQR